METGKESKKIKKAYESPALRVIELAADEVLAVGCKNRSGNAPGGGPPCAVRNCAQPGS
jgi:hypothetical protein